MGVMQGERADRLSRILVAVDCSRRAFALLDRTARLPLAQGAHITLWHAVPSTAERWTVEERNRWLADARATTKALCTRHGNAGALVSCELSHGEPHENIHAAARGANAQLVVMCRRTTIAAASSGAMVRCAVEGVHPLLLVHGVPHGPYVCPLLATGCDLDSDRLVGATRALLDMARPQVTVLTTHTPDSGPVTLESDQAHAMMAEFLTHHDDNARLEPIVVAGDAGPTIVREATHIHADIVVVGRARTRSTQRRADGTVEYVLTRARCDVLVS